MPHFLELHTYRFRAHSMFDAERYREKSEIEEWKKRDPITTFTARLLDYDILHQDDIDGMVRDIDREIAQAVDFAENGTWEPVEDLLHQVYAREVAS
jgi:TPP-dependent pyruvate/acetoin dehydrogenase alpha subunit